jgi:hypothetical protein
MWVPKLWGDRTSFAFINIVTLAPKLNFFEKRFMKTREYLNQLRKVGTKIIVRVRRGKTNDGGVRIEYCVRQSHW